MPNTSRIDILEEIRALCACGPRTPTSEGERRGHEHVAGRLRALGLAPEVEEFRCTSDIYGRIAAHAGLLVAAGTIGLAAPALGTALGAAANLSLYGDLERRWEWLGRLFPHGPSRNVLARVPAAAALRRRAVLMAHVDAGQQGPPLFFEPSRARTSARLFREMLGISPNPVQLLFWAGVAQTGLNAAAGVGLPTRLPVWALTQLQALVALHLGRAAFGPTVPGASDNASGVAVLLALADRLAREPLDGTEVWLVATGCEESGLGGAAALLDRHAGELDRERTLFVAADTLGAGSLRYCTGEGFVRRVAYDPRAVALAEAVAAEEGAPPARPFAMSFATDALIPALRGWPAISLIAADEDDYPPNYHWPSDVPEAIDPATPAAALEFAHRLLRRFDAEW